MAGTRRGSPVGPITGAIGLPLVLTAIAVGAFAAAHLIPALDPYRPQLDRIEGATIVGLGVWLVHRLLTTLLDWSLRGGPHLVDRALQVLPLGRRALHVAVIVIGVLLVLDQLGISISPLLAGLGISGIAVALALQPLLTNLFAGSYVLSDSSIRVGDTIALQTGPAGRVEEIGWRATRLRELDTDTLIIVPNATLAAATVTNYGSGGPARASVTLALPRTTDLDEAERVVIGALRALIAGDARCVPDSEPVVRFQSMTADAVTMLASVRATSQADVAAVTHEVVKALAPLGAKTTSATA